MSNEQGQDLMCKRLDATRKEIEALQLRIAEDHTVFQLNPQMVFTVVIPRLCTILTEMHDTIVLLDHRLHELEKRE